MLENSAKTKEDMAKKTPEANLAMEACAALDNSPDEFIVVCSPNGSRLLTPAFRASSRPSSCR